MKKKREIIVTVAAVLVVLTGHVPLGTSSVPAGQEPLLALSSTNFSEFEKAFDGEAGVSRLVLLASPT